MRPLSPRPPRTGNRKTYDFPMSLVLRSRIGCILFLPVFIPAPTGCSWPMADVTVSDCVTHNPIKLELPRLDRAPRGLSAQDRNDTAAQDRDDTRLAADTTSVPRQPWRSARHPVRCPRPQRRRHRGVGLAPLTADPAPRGCWAAAPPALSPCPAIACQMVCWRPLWMRPLGLPDQPGIIGACRAMAHTRPANSQAIAASTA
jgi:hypothetical protein